MARAFLATGDAHSDEGQAGPFQLGEATHRVAEIGIAGIDDDVATYEQVAKPLDLLVDRLARLHHQDDRTGRLDLGDELFERGAGDDIAAQVAGVLEERTRARRGAIVDGYRIALFSNV